MGALRVGYLNHVSLIGGAERSLLLLLRTLDRSQFTPVLLCPPGPLADEAAGLGVEVRSWRLGRVHDDLASAGRLAAVATDLLWRAADLDLLHANSLAAAVAAVPWRWLSGRPVLWHVRDLRLSPRLVTWLSRQLDGCLAISRAVASHLRELGVEPARIRLLPNAAEPAGPRPTGSRAALGLSDADEVVLAAGQFVPWKGFAHLLLAVHRLAAERPNLKLVLAGADRFGEDRDYVDACLRRLAALLPGRVLWPGWSAALPELMAVADLFVLPSEGEPFGRVLLEAAAAGLPVVATVPGGPADIVLPGRTGWLVPWGAPGRLAVAISHALEQPAERRRAMGMAAAELLTRRFGVVYQQKELARLYRKVLSGAGR